MWKALALLLAAFQLGQWLLLSRWLIREDPVTSFPAAETVVVDRAPIGDGIKFHDHGSDDGRGAEVTDRVNGLVNGVVNGGVNGGVAAANTVAVVGLPPELVDRRDLINFTKYVADQSRERYRLNVFAPTNAELFYSYLPQTECSTKVRVGGLADGGKWLCNPWRLIGSNCLVYSIGVGFTVDFDSSMIVDFGCRVFAFDPDPMTRRTAEKAINTLGRDRLQFFDWTITGGSVSGGPKRKSILDTMRSFGHQQIDVLKVDVEGGEFEIFDAFLLDDRPSASVCQILIEVHTWDAGKWRRLFRRLESAGFLLFAREVNILGFGNKMQKIAVEYSYIHTDCSRRFGLGDWPSFRNFPQRTQLPTIAAEAPQLL